jgi:hypothetical protein
VTLYETVRQKKFILDQISALFFLVKSTVISCSLLWLSIYSKLYIVPMVQTYILDPMAGDLCPKHLCVSELCLRQLYTCRSVNYLRLVWCFSDTINLSGDLWCQDYNKLVWRPMVSDYNKLVWRPMMSDYNKLVWRTMVSDYNKLVWRTMVSDYNKLVWRTMVSDYNKLVWRPMVSDYNKLVWRPMVSDYNKLVWRTMVSDYNKLVWRTMVSDYNKLVWRPMVSDYNKPVWRTMVSDTVYVPIQGLLTRPLLTMRQSEHLLEPSARDLTSVGFRTNEALY